MMLGSKDAIRIVPYFVLPQFYPIFAYHEADAPLLCSCGGVFQRLTSAAVQAQANADLGTLVQQKTASEIIF